MKLTSFFCSVLFILHMLVQPVKAQHINEPSWKGTVPQGKFLSDSIKIGLPVQYVLSLKHPQDMEIIFPDSTYNFAPFEWVSKTYFPTRTGPTGSIDSVVYTLTTFETDTIQKLRLPIYIIMNQDCTAVYARYDSIRLQRLITMPQDTLQPKINIAYQPVQLYFNYAYILGIIAGVGLLILLVYITFGKRIDRQYKLYRMGREHASFRNAFEKLTRISKTDTKVHTVENAVILWKKYMESLADKPFSTYTTKEIIEVIPNQQLAEALQHTDRIIYGQMSAEESVRSTRILGYIAKRSYIEKRAYIEKQKASTGRK